MARFARYRHLAELVPRNALPLQWAVTQMNLGTALETLGERESGTARLGKPDEGDPLVAGARGPKARALARKLAKR